MNPTKSAKIREKFRTIHYIFYIEYERLEFLLNFPVNLLNMEIINKEESKQRQSLAVMELDELEKRLSQGYRVYKKIRTTLNLKDDWDFIKLKILFMRQYSQLFLEAFDPGAGHFYLEKAREYVEKRKKLHRNPHEDDVYFYEYLVEIDRTHFFISINDYDALLRQCDQYIECATKIEMYRKKPINILVPFRIYVGCGMIYEFFNQNTEVIVNAFLRGVQILEKNIDDVGRYFLQNDLLIYVQAYVKIVKCKMRLKDYENAEQWARSTLQFISQNSYLLRVQQESQIVKKIQQLHQLALQALMTKNLIVEIPKTTNQKSPDSQQQQGQCEESQVIASHGLPPMKRNSSSNSMLNSARNRNSVPAPIFASDTKPSSKPTLNYLPNDDSLPPLPSIKIENNFTNDPSSPKSNQDNMTEHNQQQQQYSGWQEGSDTKNNKQSLNSLPFLHLNQNDSQHQQAGQNQNPISGLDESLTISSQAAQSISRPNHLQQFLKRLEEQLLMQKTHSQNSASSNQQQQFKPISQLKSEIVAENLDTLEIGRNVSKQIMEERFYNLPKQPYPPENFNLEPAEQPIESQREFSNPPSHRRHSNQHSQLPSAQSQTPQIPLQSLSVHAEELSQTSNASTMLKALDKEDTNNRSSRENSFQHLPKGEANNNNNNCTQSLSEEIENQKHNNNDSHASSSVSSASQIAIPQIIQQQQQQQQLLLQQFAVRSLNRLSSGNFIERIPEFNEEEETPSSSNKSPLKFNQLLVQPAPSTPVSLSDITESPRLSPKQAIMSSRMDDYELLNARSDEPPLSLKQSIRIQPIKTLFNNDDQRTNNKEINGITTNQQVGALIELQKVQSSQSQQQQQQQLHSMSPIRRSHLNIQRIPEDFEDADDSPKSKEQKEQNELDKQLLRNQQHQTNSQQEIPSQEQNNPLVRKNTNESQQQQHTHLSNQNSMNQQDQMECSSPLPRRRNTPRLSGLSTESTGMFRQNEIFLKNQLTPQALLSTLPPHPFGFHLQQSHHNQLLLHHSQHPAGTTAQIATTSAHQLSAVHNSYTESLNTHASFHSNFNHFASSEFPTSSVSPAGIATWMIQTPALNSNISSTSNGPAQNSPSHPRKSIFANQQNNNNNNTIADAFANQSQAMTSQLNDSHKKQFPHHQRTHSQQSSPAVTSKNENIVDQEKFTNYFTKTIQNNPKRSINSKSLNSFLRHQLPLQFPQRITNNNHNNMSSPPSPLLLLPPQKLATPSPIVIIPMPSQLRNTSEPQQPQFLEANINRISECTPQNNLSKAQSGTTGGRDDQFNSIQSETKKQKKTIDIKPFDETGEKRPDRSMSNSSSISNSSSSNSSNSSSKQSSNKTSRRNSLTKANSSELQQSMEKQKQKQHATTGKSPSQIHRKIIGLTSLEKDALKVMIRKKFDKEIHVENGVLSPNLSSKQIQPSMQNLNLKPNQLLFSSPIQQQPPPSCAQQPLTPQTFRFLLTNRQSLDFFGSRAMTSQDFDSSNSTMKSSKKFAQNLISQPDERDQLQLISTQSTKNSYLHTLTSREDTNRVMSGKFAKQNQMPIQTSLSSQNNTHRRADSQTFTSLTTIASPKPSQQSGQSASTSITTFPVFSRTSFHTFHC